MTVSFSYDGVEVARSDTLVVGLLMDTVTHPLLTEVGMVATMPTASVCSGETFPVEVRAHGRRRRGGAYGVAADNLVQHERARVRGRVLAAVQAHHLAWRGPGRDQHGQCEVRVAEADTLEHWPRKQTYSVTSDRVNMYLATLEFRGARHHQERDVRRRAEHAGR